MTKLELDKMIDDLVSVMKKRDKNKLRKSKILKLLKSERNR